MDGFDNAAASFLSSAALPGTRQLAELEEHLGRCHGSADALDVSVTLLSSLLCKLYSGAGSVAVRACREQGACGPCCPCCLLTTPSRSPLQARDAAAY